MSQHLSEIRVLTVRQPWAWAIIHGGKDVENRTTNIAGSYRGPVAIHAGLGFDADATNENDALRHAMAAKDDLSWIVRGAIIGVVDLVEVVRPGEIGHPTSESPWAMDDHYHLVLSNPRAIDPIPYRGGLGLRRITDPALIDAITTTTKTRTQ